MDFDVLLKDFTYYVEQNNGEKLSEMFSQNGVYDDYIYGAFEGRKNIETMLTNHFHQDAKDMTWKMYDSIFKDGIGYAKYRFTFTSTIQESYGSKVAVPGMACFEFEGDLIRKYSESVNGGIAMAQLNLPAGKIKRVFEKWAKRAQDNDSVLAKMYSE